MCCSWHTCLSACTLHHTAISSRNREGIGHPVWLQAWDMPRKRKCDKKRSDIFWFASVLLPTDCPLSHSRIEFCFEIASASKQSPLRRRKQPAGLAFHRDFQASCPLQFGFPCDVNLIRKIQVDQEKNTNADHKRLCRFGLCPCVACKPPSSTNFGSRYSANDSSIHLILTLDSPLTLPLGSTVLHRCCLVATPEYNILYSVRSTSYTRVDFSPLIARSSQFH